MSKYILVYKAKQAFDWTTLPEEETSKLMGAWGDWLNSIGSALQSREVFKFGGKSVSEAGSQDADNLLTGCAIVEAESFAAVEELAKSAPAVTTGRGSVEIYETLELN